MKRATSARTAACASRVVANALDTRNADDGSADVSCITWTRAARCTIADAPATIASSSASVAVARSRTATTTGRALIGEALSEPSPAVLVVEADAAPDEPADVRAALARRVAAVMHGTK